MSRRAMPSGDAAWLHMDRPTNRMIINSVLWFDAPLDWGALRELLRERLVERYPTFRRRVVEQGPLGGAAWEDDPQFDLDLHLHRRALPAPGGREQLEELVADLASGPLDRSRPLWHAYFVEGYGSSGCALVLRMHHCIADGIALAEVLLSLADEPPAQTDDGAPRRPDAPAAKGLRALVPGPVASLGRAAGALLHEGTETVLHPRHLTALAREAAADALAMAELTLAGPDAASPLRGQLSPGERVAWTDAIDLAEVRALAHAFEATINDVLCAAVAGALRRYLASRGSEDVRAVHAMVPFNLRPPGEPLPRDLGNHFGLVLLALPVGIADPLDRLRETQRGMDHIKRSRQGAVSYATLAAMGMSPPAVEDLILSFFSMKASLVLTNVPGPRTPVTLTGVPLGGVLVWAPAGGSEAMSVSVFSYAGRLTVGFLTDAALVPDPGVLAGAFTEELAALGQASS